MIMIKVFKRSFLFFFKLGLSFVMLLGGVFLTNANKLVVSAAKPKSTVKSVPQYDYYVSKKGGFTLNLPGSWSDNYVVKSFEDHKDYTYPVYQVAFAFKNTLDPLLFILIYDSKDWDRLVEEVAPIGDMLTKKGDLVYVVDYPKDFPFLDENSSDAKQWLKMIGDANLDQIKSGFFLLAN